MHLIDSNNIFICDFYDSFTYNLFSDFKRLATSVCVFKYDDEEFWKELKKKKEKYVLVLGPGPGHPSEYQNIDFKYFHDQSDVFLFGVCLGHQLILKSLGQHIQSSKYIMHGQTTRVIDEKNLIFNSTDEAEVQRYNSLTVACDEGFTEAGELLFDEQGELALVLAANFVSCQFHPESIGSSCPKGLYKRVLDFLI